VTFAYELARQLGVRGIFTERQEGRMTLRRGFQVTPGERVLVAEDAVTTGGSAAEAAEVMRAAGADVVAVAAVVDRSSGKADFGVRFEALARVTVQQFPPEECPLCARGVPIHKPGSRPGAMSSKDQSSTKGE
jgi:orotate phosphoribosyltransferase